MKLNALEANRLTRKYNRFEMEIDSIFKSIEEAAKCGLTFSKHYYATSLDKKTVKELVGHGFRVEHIYTDSVVECTIYW